MRSWRAFLETVNLVALALWLGAIVFSGVVAARVFVVMRELDPRLNAYADYTGEHWKLAGGKVANGVFAITDIAQFLCALIAGLCFAALVATRIVSPRRLSTWLRGLGLSVGMACVMGLLLVVSPRLHAALAGYWAAAREGKNDEALRLQALAGQIHPTATMLMGVGAFAVLVALVAAAWTLACDSSRQAVSGPAPSPSPYPEPDLLRRKGRGA
jgi:hypothetical protein